MAAHGEVRAAFNKYVAPNFIHHNQWFKGDRESLMVAMEQAHVAQPNKKFTVKHTYTDGDTVITHSELIMQQNEKRMAVVHISKIKDGKIVELWDLGQFLEANSPNENGPF